MFGCKLGAALPLATRPCAALLSCFISTLKTLTADFLGLPLSLLPADLTLHCNHDWGSRFSPARQAEWGKQYYCKNTRTYQELDWGGGGVLVFVFVWFCLRLVGFIVVWFLLLLLYLILDNAEEME